MGLAARANRLEIVFDKQQPAMNRSSRMVEALSIVSDAHRKYAFDVTIGVTVMSNSLDRNERNSPLKTFHRQTYQ